MTIDYSTATAAVHLYPVEVITALVRAPYHGGYQRLSLTTVRRIPEQKLFHKTMLFSITDNDMYCVADVHT
jgi:hypothetical protein